MSGTSSLCVRDVVWAKLPDQPWWPARITQIFHENEHSLYEVSFFADPFFTYLYEQHLCAFHDFDETLNAHHLPTPLYEKAKKTAFKHLKKNRETFRSIFQTSRQSGGQMGEYSCKMEENVTQNLVLGEDKDESNRSLVDCSQAQVDHELNAVTIEAISVENVLQAIENYQISQKRISYCYQQRKQSIKYQDKLKEQLLRKYRLLTLPSDPVPLPSKNIIHKRKPILKQKQNSFKNNKNIMHLRTACLRKALTLLKYSQLQDHKQAAIDIVNRLMSLSQGNAVKLNSLYMTFARSVSQPEELSQFMGYLQSLEGEKQNEQGSKVTQADQLVL